LTAEIVANLLLDLGLKVRSRICSDRVDIAVASRVVEVSAVDSIFGIDRHVEPLIVEALQGWPEGLLPVAVFSEGLHQVPLLIGGQPQDLPKYWLLIDPIDGTRGLMYDKRSAYFLAAAAPGTTRQPRLSDCIASVGVELPTSKAGWADMFVWSKGRSVRAMRADLSDSSIRSFDAIRPSTATDLSNSFGTVVAFFPQGKRRAAGLAEEIAKVNSTFGGPIQIFEDQYICTGGQMVELMIGHDRFSADLRPLLYAKDSIKGLCCHPYDLALAPLVKAAGVILTGSDGMELDAPFALDINVSWCGYANEKIKELVEPVIQRALR
jgi:hypothetical protein